MSQGRTPSFAARIRRLFDQIENPYHGFRFECLVFSVHRSPAGKVNVILRCNADAWPSLIGAGRFTSERLVCQAGSFERGEEIAARVMRALTRYREEKGWPEQ